MHSATAATTGQAATAAPPAATVAAAIATPRTYALGRCWGGWVLVSHIAAINRYPQIIHCCHQRIVIVAVVIVVVSVIAVSII